MNVIKERDILLYGVGDMAPDREEPDTLFVHIEDLFNKGDVVFGQLETNLSFRGTRLPQARHTVQIDPKAAHAFKNAGFNVISFAGNHCMDWGREAFFDTIESLEEQSISVIGVGNNIEEARRPACLEIKGTKIAFLAYNSILPMAYWAEVDRPGCVPMRAWTFYEQIEHDQPGTPCRTHTFPHREDLQAMMNDIQKAKSENDIVVLSMHWGIHLVPAQLADYQRDIARVAIDCGADLILGHHAHILKGIEVYKGKVIMYSLCNFALDLPFPEGLEDSPSFKEIQVLNPSWKPDPEYPTYTMPPDSRKTMIAKCVISDKHIKRVSFIPTVINKKSQPVILKTKDKQFEEVLAYMEEITRDQGLETEFRIDGDEVIISG
jgi:poly-gamma-glutamate synthesis protein (capsule biosynthesis protein)